MPSTTLHPILSQPQDLTDWEVIKLLSGDPGKMKSSFGCVYMNVMPNQLRVMGAKRFGGKTDSTQSTQKIDYTEIEAWFNQKHKELDLHYVPIETNNTGNHVLDDFHRFYPDVPVFPINTVGKANDPTKLASGHTMVKSDAALLTKKMKDAGILIFPEETTPELEELKRQMETFLPKVTPSGEVSYHAEGNNQDDLVMALIFDVHIGYRFLSSGQRIFLNARSVEKDNILKVLNDENAEGRTGLTWIQRK